MMNEWQLYGGICFYKPFIQILLRLDISRDTTSYTFQIVFYVSKK